MQNSDLASLGRRTVAIETLVGQLREAAEATNLPHQEEGKGDFSHPSNSLAKKGFNLTHQEEGKGDFIHLITLIHLIHWP